MAFSQGDTSSAVYEVDLMDIVTILKRWQHIIIISVLLSIVFAGIYAMVQKKSYTAQTIIQFNPKEQKVVDIDSILQPLSSNAETAIKAEIDVLVSNKLLMRVVERLSLHEREDFYDSPGVFSQIKGAIKSALKFFAKKDEVTEAESEVDKIRGAAGYLSGKLSITRERNSYTVSMYYNSHSPQLAAIILNGIVEEYLASHIHDEYEVTRKANQWLDGRVENIKKKLVESEEHVQSFMEEHNIVSTEDRDSLDGKLAELNSRLVSVQAELATNAARLKEVRDILAEGKSLETLEEVQNSGLVTDLLIEKAEILNRKSELSEVYLYKHPLMKQVNAQLDDINQSIADAVKNIVSRIENQVTSAKNEKQTLELSIDEQRERMQNLNRHQLQLSELIRERDANQAIYESFLSRFKETTEDQGFEKKTLRILEEAVAPTLPSWPKYKLLFAIAMVLGAMIGVVIAFVMEFFNHNIVSMQQITDISHVDTIGIVPELEKKFDPQAYIVSNLTSVFSESLRHINTAIQFSNPDNPPKAILVTSSAPKEGKSVFALSMAKMLACSGKKVLLVDCDLRLPSLHTSFSGLKDHGLSALLTQSATLEDVLHKDTLTGLHFIRSFPNTPHSLEILSSDKMREFVAWAKGEYDYVVLDSPPVLAISDSLHLAKIVDSTVFVIRWESTSKTLAKQSLQLLSSSSVPLAGVVLSRVDLKKYRKYNQQDLAYYYSEYNQYYTS